MSQQVYATNSETMPDIDLIGEGAVLIEKESEKVLFEKNMNQKMYPASTTKIMTAIIALEYGNLDEVVRVGNEIDEIPWYSNSANLVEGDEITLHDLLYGLLLPSGNDAANTIAVHISKKTIGAEDITLEEGHRVFSNLMNEKAKEIGANNTNFVNPHGFHHEEQYTSPWDMVIIGKYAMESDVFSEIVRTPKAIHYKDQVWETTNHLLLEDNENYYPYVTGVKTGNTAASGKCLVSTASKDNLDLISVVLKSTDGDIWPDTISLFNYGFDNFNNHLLIDEGEIVETINLRVDENNEVESLEIKAESRLEHFMPFKDIEKIEKEIIISDIYFEENLEDDRLILLQDINQGDQVASIRFMADGELIGEGALVSNEDVRMLEIIEENEVSENISLIGITIIVLIIIYIIQDSLKRRKKSEFYD